MNDAEKLLRMKQKIEEGIKEQANLQGRIDSLFDQLNKEFNVKTIKDAENLLEELEFKIKQMDMELKKRIEELEQAYNWE